MAHERPLPPGATGEAPSDRPRVSIVLPVRNGARTLAQAIQSVRVQSMQDLELIVVDGDSTDETPSIIRSFGDGVDCCIREPDRGVYDAMNKGLSRARGQWLLFLGCDDCLLEGFSEAAQRLADPATVYFGDARLGSGGLAKGIRGPRDLLRRNLVHQAIFYPRAVFASYRYDLRYPVAADYALNLQCFTDPRFRSCHIPVAVALFDDRSGLSARTRDTAFAADKGRLVRRHLGWWAHLEWATRQGLSRFERDWLRPLVRRRSGEG